MTRVPYEPASSDVIQAANEQANWDELEAAIDAIDSNNMSDNAGLLSTHLADRYTLNDITIPLYPNGTDTTIDVASTVRGRKFLRVQSGRRGWVYRVEVYVYDRGSGAGAEEPEIDVQVGGITIGGSVEQLDTDDNVHVVANSDDIGSPLIPFANNDEITIAIGSSGAAAGTLEGCYAVIGTKTELHP